MYDTLARTQLLQAHMDERMRQAEAARTARQHAAPRPRLLTSLLTRIRRSSPVAPVVPAQRPQPTQSVTQRLA